MKEKIECWQIDRDAYNDKLKGNSEAWIKSDIYNNVQKTDDL